MRPRFLLSGLVLCLAGGGIILYQLSESCEDSALKNVYSGYPWCSDVLEHINLTFVGVLILAAGILIFALGSYLHWMMEPVKTAS